MSKEWNGWADGKSSFRKLFFNLVIGAASQESGQSSLLPPSGHVTLSTYYVRLLLLLLLLLVRLFPLSEGESRRLEGCCLIRITVDTEDVEVGGRRERVGRPVDLFIDLPGHS